MYPDFTALPFGGIKEKSVTLAKNGKDAAEKVEQSDPDPMILDSGMLKMETLERLSEVLCRCCATTGKGLQAWLSATLIAAKAPECG